MTLPSRVKTDYGRLVVLPLMLVVAGCGPSHDAELADVQGIVTLDGQPVTAGYVYVTPSKGRLAKGAIQSDGSFVLGTYEESDGAPVGEHPVTVLPPPAVEGAAPPSGERMIPARYAQAKTSGLVAKVDPSGTNDLQLELTTAPE